MDKATINESIAGYNIIWMRDTDHMHERVKMVGYITLEELGGGDEPVWIRIRTNTDPNDYDFNVEASAYRSGSVSIDCVEVDIPQTIFEAIKKFKSQLREGGSA